MLSSLCCLWVSTVSLTSTVCSSLCTSTILKAKSGDQQWLVQQFQVQPTPVRPSLIQPRGPDHAPDTTQHRRWPHSQQIGELIDGSTLQFSLCTNAWHVCLVFLSQICWLCVVWLGSVKFITSCRSRTFECLNLQILTIGVMTRCLYFLSLSCLSIY